jgi:hypothetical protein
MLFSLVANQYAGVVKMANHHLDAADVKTFLTTRFPKKRRRNTKISKAIFSSVVNKL